jgi:predicted ABC-type ATPase
MFKRTPQHVLETVFSAPDKLDFLHQTKEGEFFIRFFFIGTDSPQINASMIARRVMAGGHTVPIWSQLLLTASEACQ